MNSLSQEVTLIVIGCGFFLLVAIGIIILILIYQKKQLRFIYEKKELQGQYTEELLKTRLESQEQTLNMVSKEIHDNIGQLLNSAKMLVGVAQRKLTTPEETLQTANETLGQAIQELRTLSKSLSSEWLEQFSFIENLNAEAARINASHSITMSVQHPAELTLSKDRQLVLFRIVQEAFQNSLKHSEATHIRIHAEQLEEQFIVRVEDDGKGFDLTKEGFGIANIKHRAALLGGTAHWKSLTPGTQVSLEIPTHVV
jgi:signal transduction histidine kinase